jgi:hypothetical protein
MRIEAPTSTEAAVSPAPSMVATNAVATRITVGARSKIPHLDMA